MTETEKQDRKPGTLIYPSPLALVSCGNSAEEYNITTVTRLGNLSAEPAMCYIALKPNRHSHDIIKRNMEFVINLVTEDLTKKADWCGIQSGKHHLKFDEIDLTPEKAKMIKAPIIKESPINIECRVKARVEMGTHDLFIAEILNVKIDESLINTRSQRIDLRKARLVAFSYGHYYVMKDIIGKFGYSLK